MLLSTDEIWMLEFGVIFLWFYQPTLLDMDNFPKTIYEEYINVL